MERTAYGRTNASLTRLRGSAQRPAEGKGLDRGFSLRQNLTPNRTARLVISGGSIVTPGATSIMVNPKRKKGKIGLRAQTLISGPHAFWGGLMSVPDVSPEVKAVRDAIYRLSIRTLPRVNLPTRPEPIG